MGDAYSKEPLKREQRRGLASQKDQSAFRKGDSEEAKRKRTSPFTGERRIVGIVEYG